MSPGRAKRGPGDAALRPGNIIPSILGARPALVRRIIVARYALVARTAMATAAAVQREAIAATTVVAIGVALRLILLWLRLLRLAAGNKGRQAIDVLITGRRWRGLRPRLKMLLLRLVLRLMLLLVRLLLRLAPVELRLAWRKRFAGQMRLLVVVAVKPVVADIAAHLALLLLLVIGLALPVLLLSSGDQAKIMLGVLIVVFRGDRIAGTLRIAGELQVLFGNVGGRAANFHIRSIGLVHAGQWILVMMTTFAVATPHALILTVSHGLLFCQPPFCGGYMPPLLTKTLASN